MVNQYYWQFQITRVNPIYSQYFVWVNTVKAQHKYDFQTYLKAEKDGDLFKHSVEGQTKRKPKGVNSQ